MFRIIAITHAIFAVAYAYEDDHEEGSDLWTLLFEGEQCLEARLSHFNQRWGYMNNMEGYKDANDINEKYANCDAVCESGSCMDHMFDANNFVHSENCDRLMHGDLKQRFEDEVIQNPDVYVRAEQMALMNVMCGHVEIDCAYSMFNLGSWWDYFCRHEHCDGQTWHDGYDNYYDPCDYAGDHWDGNGHWLADHEDDDQEDDDHWDDDHWEDDHWDDDHWEDDHWDDDDHSDGHLWEMIMRDNRCLEAKWILSNYKAGFTEGMEHTNQQELEYHCEDQCGHTCYQLNADDFVDDGACERIMYGDLRKIYQEQVLNAPDSDDREGMMSVKNVVCGNIKLECAYAAWEHWETVQDGRNIFEKLAEAVETPEKKECNRKCKGQMWDKGFEDLVHPCSSLMHSLSIAIILIISLLR